MGLVEDPPAHGEQLLEAQPEQLLGGAAGPDAERAVHLHDPAVGQRREVPHRRVLVEVGRVLLEQPVELTRSLTPVVLRGRHPDRNARMAAVVSSGALRFGQCPVAASCVNTLLGTCSCTYLPTGSGA